MTGLIDIGGGLRDIYGAGVLDTCLDEGIDFDYCIGVSAGSANCASYIAGQRGRNYRFYHDYAFRREYLSIDNLIRKRMLVDLEYVYGTLANADGEDPLDYEKVAQSPKELVVVSTNARTAEAVYFHKEDMQQDHYEIMMASCCLPILSTPYRFRGERYYDGGVADPIPVERALADGCDRLVLILTRPKTEFRTEGRENRMARLMRRRRPAVAAKIDARYLLYNKQLQMALDLEKAGKCLILAPSPEDVEHMKTLTKDKAQLEQLYQKGLADGKQIRAFLEAGTSDIR